MVDPHDERETPGPVLGRKPALTRRRAVTYLFGSLLAFGVGVALYAAYAPAVDVIGIQLGGDLAPKAAVSSAVLWDFALIVGYAVTFTLTAFLARSVFRSLEARRVARLFVPLAVTVVLADVIENLLTLLAVYRGAGSTLVGLRTLDLVTAAAVLKWMCLLPVAGISLAVLLVTAARLIAHRGKHLQQRPSLSVSPPDPLEGDPPARHATGAADEAARWRRGYRVPDVHVEERLPSTRVTAFCLSGGGIRSASVSLGALQALRHRLLQARYLISVSGGGYTAGALQLALTEATDPAHRASGTIMRSPASTYMPGSVEEDRMRRHASYIADSPGGMLLAVGVVTRVLLLSLAVLFAPAVLLGTGIGELYRALPVVVWVHDGTANQPPKILTGTIILLAALASVAVLAHLVTLACVAYSRRPGRAPRAVAAGATALALLVGCFAVALPWLVYAAGRLLDAQWATRVTVGGPTAAVVLTYVATLATFLRRKEVRTTGRRLFGRKDSSTVGALPGGALQMLLVAAALVVLAALWLFLAAGIAWTNLDSSESRRSTLITAGVLLVLLTVLGGVLDQTTLSLHPFYRRRLASAFAARRVARADGHVVAEGYAFDEWTLLSNYGRRPAGFPEVVFAATANLSGERRAPMNASSFTFTADWVGGPDVGYVATRDLGTAVGPSFQRDLTVQAAVAVSGAAVASAVGRAARWYTTLLAVTGVRLGTWLPNPAFLGRWNDAAAIDDWSMPGLPKLRRLTYLLREIFGVHRWSDRLLQITDGGHYENLGLIEALRRRCTEIYCIDSSGDSPPTAGTLEQAIQLAHAELGVVIVPNDDIWNLVPGSADPLQPAEPLSELNQRLSSSAVFTASIHYPQASGLVEGAPPGVLVVAKAVLVAEMPYDLLSYASRHPTFPRDSTGDQFFDDGKFVAYTSLGRWLGAAAEDAMTAARAQQAPPS